MKPRRRICDQTDTLPAASAAELVPNVLGFLSFGAYQQRREGDPDAWATHVLHIICPGLHPGEDTPASPHGVDTTREAAVTGYKPYCLTGVEQGARGYLLTVGEILGSQWTHIPKDLLYSELATGKRQTGQPKLRFKNICKQDH